MQFHDHFHPTLAYTFTNLPCFGGLSHDCPKSQTPNGPNRPNLDHSAPQLHDIDSTGLWLRARGGCGSDLEYGAHDVGCGVGHVSHHALRQVKGSVAVGSSKCIHLFNRLHGG